MGARQFFSVNIHLLQGKQLGFNPHLRAMVIQGITLKRIFFICQPHFKINFHKNSLLLIVHPYPQENATGKLGAGMVVR